MWDTANLELPRTVFDIDSNAAKICLLHQLWDNGQLPHVCLWLNLDKMLQTYLEMMAGKHNIFGLGLNSYYSHKHCCVKNILAPQSLLDLPCGVCVKAVSGRIVFKLFH